MKVLLILVTFFSLATTFASQVKETTIANPGDFVVISDVAESQISIFLSYAGKKANKCGIRLRTHSFSASAEDVLSVIRIDDNINNTSDAGIARVEEGRVVAWMEDPNKWLFGYIFTISSRSGEPLKDAFAGLNKLNLTDVIVEALTCESI